MKPIPIKKASIIHTIKVRLSLYRFWPVWIKNWFLDKYYKLFHGISMGGENTLYPQTGKGKFVSVYKKGSLIDVIDERSGDIFRFIPYQPNHGFMVELIRDGKIVSRLHFSTTEMMEHCTYRMERR